MEVGGEGDGGRLYPHRYTVTTRMASAVRWAAAVLTAFIFIASVLGNIREERIAKL